MLVILLYAVIALPALLVVVDFLGYLINKKRLLGRGLIFRVVEAVVVLGYPFLFLQIVDSGPYLDCCNDLTFFSPEHRSTLNFWILTCLAVYLYASYRDELAPPIVEILINGTLVTGVLLNMAVAFQLYSEWSLGVLPIFLLFILVLSERQQRMQQAIRAGAFKANGTLSRMAIRILSLRSLDQYPLLFLLVLPILAIASSVLLLFGQQPDSIIRAFTDTYYRGFSQLNAECENVHCGGHYLCSVAAKGHPAVVKPQRLGERNGKLILCNRQLLVANAFEELLTVHFPRLHVHVRQQYNKIGQLIHQYYGIFNNRYISDAVYLLMKPLELLFLLYLYSFEQKPENRIARQYLSPKKTAHLCKKLQKS